MNRPNLQLVVPETESPSANIRNALTILRHTQPLEQSPMEVSKSLTAVEGRLMNALAVLEPPPPAGLPEFTGSVSQGDGQGEIDTGHRLEPPRPA